MSMTKFGCPSCKTVLQAGALAPGSRVRCPRCGTLILMPGAPTPAGVPPRPQQAVQAQPANRLPAEPRSAPPTAPPQRRGRRVLLWGLLGCGALVLLLAVGLGGAVVGALFLGRAAQVAQAPSGTAPAVDVPQPVGPVEPPATGRENRDQSPPATADPKKPALDFIAPDFTAAVVVRPQRFLRSPLLAGLPQDQLLSDLIKQSGIDPRQLKEATLLAEPFAGGNVAFFPAGILRFADPVDGKQLLDKALQGVSEQTLAGKQYYRSTSPQHQLAGVPVCGHVADERTLVLAPETTLKKMLAATDGTSPLRQRLVRLDADADVVGLFVLDQDSVKDGVPTVRRALTDILKQNQKAIPPQLGDVTTLPERLQAVTVALYLTGDTLLRVDLEATDPMAAAAVHDLAKGGLDLFRQSLPELHKAMDAQAPPDVAQPLGSVLDDAAGGISLNKDGARVAVTVKAPKDPATLPAKLGPLLAQLVAEGPRPGPGPAGAAAAPAPAAPAGTRDQAVAWIKANNALGPDHQIVADVQKQMATDVGPGRNFLMRLGSALVKSKKQTYLAGMGSELYVFELTPEQEKTNPLDPASYSLARTPVPQDLGPGVQGYEITSGTIQNAAALPGDKDITGEVAVKAVGKRPDYYSLRLTGLSLGGPAVVAYDHKLGPALAGVPEGRFTFHFPPLVEAGQKSYAGPAAFVLEVVAYPTGDKQGTPFVASNPLAALVFVGSPPAGSPPPAVPPIIRKFPAPLAPAPSPPAPPIGPPTAAAADMSKLQATLPAGWKADYNKFLQAWDFTRCTPGPNGLNESNRLTVMEEADPLPLDVFAEKLKEKDFLNIDQLWTEFTEKGKLPDGWYIEGVVTNYRDKNEKPHLGLVVVRDVAGVKLRCKSTDLRIEDLRKEALELCRSLKLGPGK
jgi:hypothetical protein